nr:unnamed protein product [Spirometra erinaceieuropaei]
MQPSEQRSKRGLRQGRKPNTAESTGNTNAAAPQPGSEEGAIVTTVASSTYLADEKMDGRGSTNEPYEGAIVTATYPGSVFKCRLPIAENFLRPNSEALKQQKVKFRLLASPSRRKVAAGHVKLHRLTVPQDEVVLRMGFDASNKEAISVDPDAGDGDHPRTVGKSSRGLRSRSAEAARLWKERSCELEKRLRVLRHICEKLPKKDPQTDDVWDASSDACLPALFMPRRMAHGNLYNPRAHQYFHPLGSTVVRLTQPPSMLQLPPITSRELRLFKPFLMGRRGMDDLTKASWLAEDKKVPEK